MAVATRRTNSLCQTLLTLTTLLVSFSTFGKCDIGLSDKTIDEQQDLQLQDGFAISQVNNNSHKCESVYQEYLTAVQNFIHCEIYHVRPFRLCLTCREQFQVADDFYLELNSNPDHEPCKIKYMMSDKIQIIPTVQTDLEKLWRRSHCHRCYSKNDTLREKVSKFMTQYSDFSICINATVEEGMRNLLEAGGSAGNNTDICIKCKSQYTSLNTNFNEIYEADAGDVCMDIMDMMNYTRIMWSSQFNCTPGSFDSTPVVIISCIVACTPIVFYVYLRVTGKVRLAKLFKPKRLPGSTDVSSGSYSTGASSLSSR